MTLLLLLAAVLSPAQKAREAAKAFQPQFLELRRAAAAIRDPALRAAVEAQILAPWLPDQAWGYSHPGETPLPPPRSGEFASAPGGNCEDGHHGYPGGLAVHALSNLLHARALAGTYEHVYGIKLDDDWLVAAAIWHDSLKAATLPFTEDGSCGPEAQIAGTNAHHVLGLAAAILRHLPRELIFVIASAHLPPTPGANYETVCSWVKAADRIATGTTGTCPPRPAVEAFVSHFADADYAFTGTTWAEYVRRAPKGWARYQALQADGNDVALFHRAH